MHKIVVSDSMGNEYTYPVAEAEGTTVSVGRRMTNDIILGKATVSRHHVTIRIATEGKATVDVHSSNGVVHRGRTTHSPITLGDRDEFLIDEYTLRYELAHDTQPMDPALATPSVMHDGRVTDMRLLNSLDAGALVGHRFCFIDRAELFSHLPAWMRAFVDDGDGAGTVVLPLFEESVELPGASVSPPRFNPVKMRSVTTDRALYREMSDVVELLVFAPGPDREGVLELSRNGMRFETHPYRTDPFGVATLSIEDLPAGSWEVAFGDQDEDEPTCEFTVAAFQLAGLTATLRDRRIADETLHVELGLESFGTPVDGAVRLGLLSDGVRVSEGQFTARDGVLSASLGASGEGPFDVEIQLVEDPSRTATVRIVGTRRAEREETLVCALDRELFASLVPREGAREVRGLWVTEAGHRVSLFELDDIEANPARLVARTDIAQACAVLLVAGEKPRTLGSRGLAAGEAWEVELPDSVNTGVIAIGAMTPDGRAWEGWTLVARPRELAAEVLVPDETPPGETIEVGVRVDGLESGVAYFVVKDERLVTPDTPENRLAGAIKRWADEADTLLGAGFVDTSLADAIPQTREHQAYLMTSYQQQASFDGAVNYARAPSLSSPAPSGAANFGAAQRGAGMPQSPELAVGGAPPPAATEGSAAGAEPDAPPPATEEATVFFVGSTRIAGGEASVEVELPDGFADILVEVFVAGADDTVSAETRFRVERTPFAAVEIPPYVHRSDSGIGTVTAFAAGRLRVGVTRDGEAVGLIDADGAPTSNEFDGPRAEVRFTVGPGDYEITVEDLGSDMSHSVRKRVTEPGKLRAIARAPQILEPGDNITTDEPGLLRLRVLPGLKQPFDVLCKATTNYEHLCIEQTSAKIVAACAMYLFAGDDRGLQQEAKRAIRAGVRRVERMYLQGQGFKTYPTSADHPDRHWGVMAVGYLRFLHVIETNDIGLRDVLTNGITMATDAGHAYGIQFPPVSPSNPQQTYLAARFSESAAARSNAVDRARAWVENPAQEVNSHGRVNGRRDNAWTAATLLREGEPSDLAPALRLANEVVAELNPQGRLYSTMDSVAAIALMAELAGAGVVGGAARVEVDGSELDTADAVEIAEPRSVTCREGRAIVEVTRLVEEDWEKFQPDADLRVRIEQDGRSTSRLTTGGSAEIVVELLDGYEMGDVLWVCLPPALSRIEGGGQVKLFSVDFAEATTLRVPLAATSGTAGGKQHFMVCVRNMFDEDRTGNPGPLTVRVD